VFEVTKICRVLRTMTRKQIPIRLVLEQQPLLRMLKQKSYTAEFCAAIILATALELGCISRSDLTPLGQMAIADHEEIMAADETV